ncbi:unnamed protein product [Chrysoparadoxa australica]
MFVLTEVSDKLKVKPDQFDRPELDVLTEAVDLKYSNRVLLDVGLCICLHDFISIGEAYIYPGEGSVHYKARFRLLVFKPFVGEILTGKLTSSSKSGITVSLGRFFESITVPSYLLQTPSEYDESKKCWVWNYPASDDEEEGVAEVSMVGYALISISPGPNPKPQSVDLGRTEQTPSAMEIVGNINEDGLGLVSWWD